LNDHIRYSDSLMMLNVLKASQSNTTILPIYISNTHSN